MILEFGPEAPFILHALAAAALFLHIAGASVAIVAGGVAMFARKGERLHRVAGTVFFLSMLTMTGVAAIVAPLLPEAQWTNTTAAVFTLYLVATAWATVRRGEGEVGRFERAAVFAPLGIATMALALVLVGLATDQADGFATVYAFGVISALAAVCDLSMIRRGGLAGADRIARHLWRMSLALFVATGSFFFGQADELPAAVRATVIPTVLGLTPLVLMVFWMVRVRVGRAFRPAAAAMFVMLAAGVALSASSDAEAADYRAPRTAFGTPDLQGLWTNTALTFLQRPPIFKSLIATDKEAAMMLAGFKQMAGDLLDDKPIDPNLGAPPVVKTAPQADFIEMDLNLARINGQMRTSWIVEPADGRLPLTDAGRAAGRESNKESFDGPEGRPLMERCLIAIGSPEGPPMMNTGFNGHYQILQTKDHVAIHTEMNHDVRIVRMNDRRHLPDHVRPWMGDSVGWWEGETLVVETTNFPKGYLVGSLGGGFVYSAKGKVTERFTRTAKDVILYEFTVDDPLHFKQPWRGEMPMRTAKGPIYEYACHEGNYSLSNALSGARVQEQEAAATAVTAPRPGAP